MDETGRVTGVIGTAVDITRQRRLAAEREQYRRELNQTLEQLQKAAFEIVQGLAGAVEAKDPYTRGHARRVRQICLAMARRAGSATGTRTSWSSPPSCTTWARSGCAARCSTRRSA